MHDVNPLQRNKVNDEYFLNNIRYFCPPLKANFSMQRIEWRYDLLGDKYSREELFLL